MNESPRHYLLFYDLRFLGTGPSFDELAHYFSFEQLIHHAFDGVFSKLSPSTLKQWMELVENEVVDFLTSAEARDYTRNDELIAKGMVSVLIQYVEWLAPYVLFRVNSINHCVQLVTVLGYDVYIHCENLEYWDESVSESTTASAYHSTLLRL